MMTRPIRSLVRFEFFLWLFPFLLMLPPPAQSLPTAPSGEVSDAATTITLDFKEADINTVLRVLSLKSKVNIVAGPEVQGTVTIRLENVPWEKALETVLRTYDYVYERDGNIIRVTTREKMAQEPVVTQTYILNYTRAAEVQESVTDMLTERGRIRVADRINSLIITDIPTNLYRIQEVIKRLDQRTPQAFIDSKIVKTALGVAEDLGISWTPTTTLSGSKRPTLFPFMQATSNSRGQAERIPDWVRNFLPITSTTTTDQQNSVDVRGFPHADVSISSTYTFGTLDFTSFSAILEALKTYSNTKVVSNPRIVVLNNQKANVKVGEQIPLPTFERNENTGSMEVTGYEYRDVGVILNVTPHINSTEEILVELTPEVSTTGQTIDFGDFQIPSFDITMAITQVLIRSGETIAIGGLLTDATETAKNTVPWLESVPFFGKIFRSKRQTSGSGNEQVETLFFVTVTMVDTEGQPVGERIELRKKRKYGGQNQGQVSGSAGDPRVPLQEAQIDVRETPSETPVPTAEPAAADVDGQAALSQTESSTASGEAGSSSEAQAEQPAAAQS